MSLFTKNDPTPVTASVLEATLARLALFPAFPFYFTEATRPAGTASFWYSAGGPYTSDVNSAFVPSVGRLSLFPFFSGPGGIVDRIMMNVTVSGGAGSQLRFGIYGDNGYYPGALLFDGGDTDSNVVSTKVITVTPNVRLESNTLYWFGYICGTGAPTLTSVGGTTGNTGLYSLFGVTDPTGGAGVWGWMNVRGYGALPNPFPTGQAQRGVQSTGDGFPMIAVRFASTL